MLLTAVNYISQMSTVKKYDNAFSLQSSSKQLSALVLKLLLVFFVFRASRMRSPKPFFS